MWTRRTLEEAQLLMQVARGERPADLALVGGRVLFVQSGELMPANVAVAGRRIAYVGPSTDFLGPKTEVVDCTGKVVVPGYVEPHTHPTQMVTPTEFARMVLRTGTTTLVADTLAVLSLADPSRWGELLETLHQLPVQYLWFLRFQRPTRSAGSERFELDLLETVLHLPSVVAAGEFTRWTELYRGEESVLRKLVRARRMGLRAEGHLPGVPYDWVQVLTAAGLSSDHEPITPQEARDRLRSGLHVMLRHSSLRQDLPALAEVVRQAGPAVGRLMLTADGSDVAYVVRHGYLDHLLRVAMKCGVSPLTAYPLVTLNPATYYGLDEEFGMVAPGRLADLLVLPSLEEPTPERVIAKGRMAVEGGVLRIAFPQVDWARYFPPRFRAEWAPQPDWFVFPAQGPEVSLVGMELDNAVITRRREWNLPVRAGRAVLPEGVVLAALLDHRKRWMVRAPLGNFARRLGGLACTFNVAHELLVCGQHPEDMALAVRRVQAMSGGVALVEEGAVRFELPLPFGGLMSSLPYEEVAARIERLLELLRARGYVHEDILYTLLFLPSDGLPRVRLMAEGLWDVRANRLLRPPEPLGSGG